ncbi:anaerobic ribonucleoside-triphosphate reductase activating protein [Oribacterium sp. WCC10]|uniref:anaerobic ribonucleoside-triphosphate reductase activating protein n=1 Tax=Oribacterium sp. WCC10 TaxID=1855343 RepID=UPI0008EF5C87|nr:anaerobic ribonucleoside-triphosphate reductase activating protein [Oribacterium sp. WCC10]SFG25913.1 anaerobic ribonucleoside-triphosphate reductase activating protein [Oribacterium sp. WCC10]
MHYAEIKHFDIANGPGVRLSLFVSGCTHKCPGCFNEVAWPFDYGKEFTREVEDSILDELSDEAYQGMTLLGGEPFEPQNQKGLISLITRFKDRYPEKDLWIFSGYLFDEDMLGWMSEQCPETKEILKRADVIVDGEFKIALKDITLLYKGSSNQRTIDVQKSLETGEIVQWDPGEGTTVSSRTHL